MERLLEEAWRARGIEYVTVRFSDFYGPYVDNPLFDPLFRAALAGKSLTWYGALDAPLEVVAIEDAGAALVEAGMDPASAGETYHVPGPEVTTARAWLGLPGRAAKRELPARAVPPG